MKSHDSHLPKSDLEIVYNIKYFFCFYIYLFKSKSVLFVYALFWCCSRVLVVHLYYVIMYLIYICNKYNKILCSRMANNLLYFLCSRNCIHFLCVLYILIQCNNASYIYNRFFLYFILITLYFKVSLFQCNYTLQYGVILINYMYLPYALA